MAVKLNRVHQINVRLSDAGREVLFALQEHYGLAQGPLFELLLREQARQVGIDPQKPKRKLGSTLGTGKGGRV